MIQVICSGCYCSVCSWKDDEDFPHACSTRESWNNVPRCPLLSWTKRLFCKLCKWRPEWAAVKGDCEWMNGLFQTHLSCCLAWGLNPAVRSVKFKAWVLPHWGRGSLRLCGAAEIWLQWHAVQLLTSLLVILCACEGALRRQWHKLSCAPVTPMGVSRSCCLSHQRGKEGPCRPQLVTAVIG